MESHLIILLTVGHSCPDYC